MSFHNENISFAEWLMAMEAVDFDLTRKIRKGYQQSRKIAGQYRKGIKAANKKTAKKSIRNIRKYKPGTWGLEIEFRASGEDDIDYDEFTDLLHNDENVRDAAREAVMEDAPPTVEMWEEDNPEPEDDKEWNPEDNTANWSAIGGFKKVYEEETGENFPKEEFEEKYAYSNPESNTRIRDLSNLIYKWWTRGLVADSDDIDNQQKWSEFKNNYRKKLQEAAFHKDVPNAARLKFLVNTMHHSDNNWGEKAQELYKSLQRTEDQYVKDDYFLQKLKDVFGPPETWKTTVKNPDSFRRTTLLTSRNGDKIVETGEELVKAIQIAAEVGKQTVSDETVEHIRFYMEKVFQWNDKQIKNLEHVSQEEWEEKYEQHISDEKETWQQEREEVEDEWQKWEEEGEQEAIGEFISNITPEEAQSQYGVELPKYGEGVDAKIEHYINVIDDISGQHAQEGNAEDGVWGVGEDEQNVVEIRSPICTTKDFPALKELLDALQYEEFDGGTSAHVHIGMPENTDAFDLIAMTTLADEHAIERDAGYDRQFDRWAQMNKSVHNALYRWFERRFKQDNIYTNEEGLSAIGNISRTMGTNLQAFFDHGTVEFRYLSSQIVHEPEKLIRWIQYYLMLPQIASSRKQLRIQAGSNNMIITRQPGGNFRVDLDKDSVPQPSASPHELRNTIQPGENQWNKRLEKIVLKRFGNQIIMNIPAVFQTSIKNYRFANMLSRMASKRNMSMDALYKQPLKDLWPEFPELDKQTILKIMSDSKLIPQPPSDKLSVR